MLLLFTTNMIEVVYAESNGIIFDDFDRTFQGILFFDVD